MTATPVSWQRGNSPFRAISEFLSNWSSTSRPAGDSSISRAWRSAATTSSPKKWLASTASRATVSVIRLAGISRMVICLVAKRISGCALQLREQTVGVYHVLVQGKRVRFETEREPHELGDEEDR